MNKRSISLLVFAFMPGILLESCNIQASVSSQEALEVSTNTQTETSPLPIRFQPSLANYITYEDAEALESQADLVVVGKPFASLEDSQPVSIRDEEGLVVDKQTITLVKVQKVFQGKIVEKEIKVIQPAALVQEPNQNHFIICMGGYSPMMKDSKYLLFLQEVDTVTFPHLAGVYSILSVNQGKFNFDNTDKQEIKMEAQDEQYRQLKTKVRNKYESLMNEFS